MLKRLNWTMTVAVLLLLVVGVLFIYSACYVNEEQPVRDLYRKQIAVSLSGLVLYVAFAVFDYRKLGDLAWWIYGGVVILLGFVLVFGTKFYGAKRWLALGGVSIQPSEFAKLAVIVLLARRLSRPVSDLRRVGALVEMAAIVGIPLALVARQPDLGTAIVFVPIALAMMFVAGVSSRVLGVVLGSALLAVSLVLALLFLPEKMGWSKETEHRLEHLTGLSEYQKKRLEVFIDPSRSPTGAGWNRLQSEIAVGSGGLWGKGFLKGTQNVLEFLPRSVAPMEFVYSVIAEEKGFVGSLLVLVLFGVILTGCLAPAFMTRNKMGRCLCVGIATMLFFHVFVNISMTVGLLPITGIPLPLVSYGGSFMLVSMSALGLVQSVNLRLHRT